MSKDLACYSAVSDLSHPKRILYQEQIKGVRIEPTLHKLQLLGEPGALFFVLGPLANYLSIPEILLTWRLTWNALTWASEWVGQICRTVIDVTFVLKKLLSTTFCYCPQVRPFWNHVGELTAHVDQEHLVSIDQAYARENVSPSCSGVRRADFLTLLTEARM